MIQITDFHSHILPGMDDGAANTAAACLMLALSARQGVRRIVATPHFYPDQEDPATFLRRRSRAARHLWEAMEDGVYPTVCLGAEVAYYPGISYSPEISSLTVFGTRILLVEMPNAPWTDNILDDLCRLRSERGLQPVIAHVERCLYRQKRGMLEELKTNSILLQTNAEAFLTLTARLRSVRLLRQTEIILLGSDAHNMTHRRPALMDAVNVIRTECGEERLQKISLFSEALLQDAVSLRDIASGHAVPKNSTA